MTASLPVPHDASSNPEDGSPGEKSARVVPLAGAQAKAPRTSKARTPRRLKAVAPAAGSRLADPVPDPGPPPPLPPDLAAPVPTVPDPLADPLTDIVIPPRPPLPVPAAALVVEEPDAVEADAVAAEVVEPDVVEPEVVEPEVEAIEPDAVEPEADEPELSELELIIGREFAEPDAEPDAVDPDATAPAEAQHPDPFAASVTIEAAADAGEAVLVVRGVTKSFGATRAVDALDLTVPAGTFYGIVGPNGAGKTTTLSLIAGLLRPDKGSILVNGLDVRSRSAGAKRLMGVLPDRLRTFDRLTGRQLLYYYGVLRGLRSSVVESRIADLARAFDLTDSLRRPVSDYSAGMVKKVMLAGALIHSPRLLVLDEPFESVDPVSSAIILDILSAYVAHGGTVILSSHGMEFVERVCTRVAVIVAGQVLAEGTVAEVRGELTLEQRFVELAGGLSDVEGLEWLHTFSD